MLRHAADINKLHDRCQQCCLIFPRGYGNPRHLIVCIPGVTLTGAIRFLRV